MTSDDAGRQWGDRMAITCRTRFDADYAITVTLIGSPPLADGSGEAVTAWYPSPITRRTPARPVR
ncbi:MAG: hypothetical protein R3B90_14225 [Planctomycetaceae bacterium]